MATKPLFPLQVFRFLVEFSQISLKPSDKGSAMTVCQCAFAECTGLEATMEPKTIKEGGRNYGAAQRAGQTTFATVVLKRGIGQADLWKIFNTVANGAYAPRLLVKISVFSPDEKGAPAGVLGWQLDRAMPVKYKFADLNARGTEIGIEELHLVHEGLSSVKPTATLTPPKKS